MKTKCAILTLMTVVALVGCAPKSDSSSETSGMSQSSPAQPPTAETTGAKTNAPDSDNSTNIPASGANAPTPQ
jgi:hypothetical protein